MTALAPSYMDEQLDEVFPQPDETRTQVTQSPPEATLH